MGECWSPHVYPGCVVIFFIPYIWLDCLEISVYGALGWSESDSVTDKSLDQLEVDIIG